MELLNDMALFVEVVKRRSFRGAAEALKMPNSTLSRRIGALEKAIGLRLLNRTTRRIEPTEAGQVYYERCRRIVDEARLAHEQLGEMLSQPEGLLRVSLSVDFALTYLAPAITQFSERYPGIRFELDLTPRNVDLVAEPFDLAIRMGEPPDSSLIARLLARLTPSLFASPRYLQARGEPKEPEELSEHECLVFPQTRSWTLQDGTRTLEVATDTRLRVNSVGLLRRFATLGRGVVLIPHQIAADDLAAGQLRQILPGWHGTAIPVYAITETRLLPAKTQRFIEYLRTFLKGAYDGPDMAAP
nr:LysR family transcriptional regulator [Sphingomonas sp. CDS-1]